MYREHPRNLACVGCRVALLDLHLGLDLVATVIIVGVIVQRYVALFVNFLHVDNGLV